MSAADAALRALAEAAGLCEHWMDFRHRPKQVPLESLRAVLQALGLPAQSAAEVDESRRLLRREEAETLPPLLVGHAASALRLPEAFAATVDRDCDLQLEHGGTHPARPYRDDAGHLRMQLPAQPGYHRLRCGDTEVVFAVAPATPAARRGPPRFALSTQLYGLRRRGGTVDRPEQAHGDPGVGDLGLGDFTALQALVRSSAAAGADALAISPVHALFSADPHHFSPYSPSSRLFLNVLHVDPAAIAGPAWLRQALQRLDAEDEAAGLAASEQVDWPRAAMLKLRLLRALWNDFERLPQAPALRRELDAFVRSHGAALDDHARFEALHAARFAADPGQWHWRRWPASLRDPRSDAVAAFAAAHADEVAFHRFLQWLAARGLAAAQAAARDAGMGVGLVADLAVGTDSGGSHAWSRQHDMLAGISIGAPPDELNGLGQDWGLTAFSPRALRQHGYAPFIELLRASLREAGGVRIDHILGLNRLWLVPEGAASSAGAYLRYPLHDLLGLVALEALRHDALVIGEDLGTVPAGLRDELRDRGVLGMRVLWFERDHGLFVEPARWSAHAIATTATHDVATVAGWWQGIDLDWQQRLELLPDDRDPRQDREQRQTERGALWAAFRHAGIAEGEAPPQGEPAPVVDAAIEFVAATPAPLAIIPLEDLLGCSEQPNLPGTIDQHPNWRRRLPRPVETLFDDRAVGERLRRLDAVRGRR